MTVAELIEKPLQLEEVELLHRQNDERIAKHKLSDPDQDYCLCTPVDCLELARLLVLIRRLREELSFARQEK